MSSRIELGVGSTEEVLSKTRRLAGALGNADYERWLGYELAGYPTELDADVAALLKRANVPSSGERRTYFSSSLPAITAGLGKLSTAVAHNRKFASMSGRRAHFTATPLDKETLAKWDKQEKDARHHESASPARPVCACGGVEVRW